MAASNSDLRARVQSGQFREDLYHRLDVLSLRIPPLRDRRADIPLLAAHFLERYAAEYRRPKPQLTPEASAHLIAYHWPGNVRELQSVMRRAVVHRAGAPLGPADLELSFAPPAAAAAPAQDFRVAKSSVIDGFEREYLVKLLSTWQGNVSRAAKAAGKERRAFQRLLRKHSLDRQSFLVRRPD